MGAAASEGVCHSIDGAPGLGGVLTLPKPAKQPNLGRVRVEAAEVSLLAEVSRPSESWQTPRPRPPRPQHLLGLSDDSNNSTRNLTSATVVVTRIGIYSIVDEAFDLL